MDREIKYRGIDIDTKKWVYGDLVHQAMTSSSKIVEVAIKELGMYPVEVIPETVGQYTGLKDSKGIEIYEDDELMYVGSNMSNMFVKFEDGCFVGEGPFNTHPLITYFNAGDFHSIEVINNIHDTPNLTNTNAEGQ